MKYSEFTFPSVVKGQNIFTRLYEPENSPKAVLQIIHGMAEHSGLYIEFCKYMAEEGYLVVQDDHLGHGRTVVNGNDFGCFFEGGIDNLIRDEKQLHDMFAEKYPNLPYFMMGHSMGSFILRDYISRFDDKLSGAIIMGTAGPVSEAVWKAEKLIFDAIIARKGYRGKSDFIAKLATAGFKKYFPESPCAWVTSDKAEAERYEKDPLCGFPLTVEAYKGIMGLMYSINRPENFEKVSVKLPILMVSGREDPVGDMGKGVRRAAAGLVKTEHDVDLILYPGVRHALINEVNRNQVFRDIKNFVESKTVRFRIAEKKRKLTQAK